MAVAKDAMNPGIIALLKAGSEAKKIAITDISMRGCSGRTTLFLDRTQPVTLQLIHDKGNGKYAAYQPISATVEGSTRKKGGSTYVYEVKLAFKGAISANQGVAQTLERAHSLPEETGTQAQVPAGSVETSLEVTNGSLYVIPVTCHMCGQEHIPFISLQSRTMESKMNVFGVPQYKKALPGKEFCNYNLLRVTICPKCYFASGEVTDFIRESGKLKNPPDPFNKEPIVDQWLNSIAQRQKLIGNRMDGLFGEKRTLEQALLSYDLAIASSDALLSVEKQKNERARNYEVARNGVSSLMIKAELMMSNKKPKEAQILLKTALKKLQEIYPYLVKESSIKASYLMGMLGLYFENAKIAGQALNFLRQYEKNNRIRFNSDEQKTLVSSLKMLEEAYQNRSDFCRSALKGFDKPY